MSRSRFVVVTWGFFFVVFFFVFVVFVPRPLCLPATARLVFIRFSKRSPASPLLRFNDASADFPEATSLTTCKPVRAPSRNNAFPPRWNSGSANDRYPTARCRDLHSRQTPGVRDPSDA